MRLESIHVRDLGPFCDYSLDLSELPEEARLVAIVGPNGSGKSTLLELWTGGALYRECATRGSLAALATSRSATLEARVANGSQWTIRHTVDAASGKGESIALDASGTPVTSTGKVRDFDRWASSVLPAPEVLYASMVAAQGSGGFLELKPGDRKATLLRILGVERLEGLAKAARERASEQRAECDTLQARLTDESARGGDVAELERMVADARVELARAESELQSARAELDAARDEAARYSSERAAYRAAAEAWVKLERDLTASRAEVEQLTKRIENNRALLAEADTVRKAVAAVHRLEQEREQLIKRGAVLSSDVASTAAHEAAAGRRLVELTGRIANECARADALRSRLGRAAEVAISVESVPELTADVELCRSNAESAERSLDALRGQRVIGAEDRVAALRGSLDQIRRDAPFGLTGESAGRIAAEALREDDQAVERADELPHQIDVATGELEMYRGSLRKAQDRLSKATEIAALAERMAADRVELDCLELAIEDLRSESRSVDAERRQLSERLHSLSTKRKQLTAHLTDIEAQAAAERALASEADQLAKAEARIAELEPHVAFASARVVSLERELSEFPVPDAPKPPASDVAQAERALRASATYRDAAHGALARRERDLDCARESAARCAELSEQLSVESAELGDWNRLAADLGRDGLQATLIDAAGPELTVLTNDLLHSCIGSRWTVSFETTRLSSDGRKQLEGLDVRVIDSERGRDAQAETLSGGEKVLVGEAVSLALSVLACRRAGIERPTLVRDESGAALDPERGRAYVAMLRRAIDLTGADRCLLVSHSREVQDLCDARVEVGATR